MIAIASRPLQLVFPPVGQLQEHPSIEVQFAFNNGIFEAKFDVKEHKTFVNPAFPRDESVWGLWDWDVVEVFLRANASDTYYEFQLSPLGQFFELEIFEPRKKMNNKFRSDFSHQSTITAAGAWSAIFRVPLKKIGWDEKPESIVGNAFAVLGEKPRTYWSAFLPRQAKPDFHLPEFFRPFFSCKAASC